MRQGAARGIRAFAAAVIRTAIAMVAAALAAPAAARAQGFPSKPMRLIVPYNTVGLPDILARLVSTKMAESTGQPVVVDNKPSAGGILAYELAAKAPPDGHTFILVGAAHFTITPVLYPNIPYDPVRDFTPVTEALVGPYFLVANASLGVHSVRELIALARTRPGLAYGSPGNGQVAHLAMEQLKLSAKVDFTHVPYKGVAQATPALLAGDVGIMFVTLPSVASAVKAGKLRVLAVASAQRSASLPQAPTLQESGFPLEAGLSIGFALPAAAPRAVVERLNAELVKALKTPGMESTFASYGVDVVAGTPEQFAEELRRSREMYARLVPRIGLKVD
jgi:tripartite-type tricarboxylate transporter receptor subunit TctC